MVQPEAKGILVPPKYSRLWRAQQSIVDFAGTCKVIYLKTDISFIKGSQSVNLSVFRFVFWCGLFEEQC